ncbi:MAG: hypothetical protein K8H99_10925 [Nitrospirae bacterium]|nr:hypothetical protein [Fimbriimonadaceae bacterium]
MLDQVLVAAEDLVDPRGVVRASRILEDGGEVQPRSVVFAQPQLLADAHGQQARPHGMALRLPLDEVQRDAERREDFGKRYRNDIVGHE